MKTVLPYAGAAIVILWGVAHIAIPTRSIVDGFGPISPDNRRILLMEWLMEGVLLLFVDYVAGYIAVTMWSPGLCSVLRFRPCISH